MTKKQLEDFQKAIKKLRETEPDIASELLDLYLTLRKETGDSKKLMENISMALQAPFAQQFEALTQRTATQACFVYTQVDKKKNRQIFIGGDPEVKAYLGRIMKMAGEAEPPAKPKIVTPHGD